jgi:hypothetical protein
MIYCTPERCAVCQLIPSTDFCLRRQARRRVALSNKAVCQGVSDALRDLGTQLTVAAEAVEQTVI